MTEYVLKNGGGFQPVGCSTVEGVQLPPRMKDNA